MRTMLTFLAAVLLLGVLFAAQFAPASPLFWEASLSLDIMILRVALVGILLWFLIYTPETPWVRIPVGAANTLVMAWIASASSQGRLGFVDIMTLAPPVIAVFVALLESKPADEPFRLFESVRRLRSRGVHASKALFTHGLQLGWLLLTDIRLALDEDRPPAAAEVRLM